MAKITATFDQRVTRNGYCLGVTISDYDDTDPVELENCILVSLGGSSNIVRAATVLDLYSYTTPTVYPLNQITGDGIFNSVQVNDTINFYTIPEHWEITESAETLSMAVSNNDFAASLGAISLTTSALVNAEFSCGFDGILELEVLDSLGDPRVPRAEYTVVVGRFPNGGTLPTYNQVLQLYYPVKRAVTIFPNVTEALNKLDSIKAELQSLVTESNTAGVDFETTTVEVFE
jgi:hypothetical protein